MKTLRDNIHDWAATAGGIIVAVAQAYMTIDWESFSLNRDWPKLLLSGVIATGGYMSKFKDSLKA